MILSIDTSSSRGSVALGTGGAESFREEIFEESTRESGKGTGRHSAALFPALERLGLSRLPAPLERIVVGLGPGSFSGIRVALAAAQGIALPGGVPVVGVCSAWSVAQRFRHVTRLGVFADARRGEYYCTIYANGVLERPTRVLSPAEAEETVGKVTLAVSAEALPFVPERAFPSAADYLSLPVGSPDLVRSETLEPIYLREPV